MSDRRTGLLLATVFATGAAVMVVEMTAVRALQPFFGSTSPVWTNVIAVVLAALAAGYAVGGRLADRRPSPTLLFSLMASGGVLLVLTAALSTPVSRLFLAEGVDIAGAPSLLQRGSLGVTLTLFAPPILLLGMVAPLAVRLLAGSGVGEAAGRVFALSTVGSILGTYLPALWLVPALGSRGAILLAAAVLLAAGATGLATLGRRRVVAGVLGALALGAVLVAARRDLAPARGAPFVPDGGGSTVLAEVESPYQYLTVRDDAYPDGSTYRVLTINEGVHSFHSYRLEGSVLTGSRHYDDYSVVPLLLSLEPGAELRAGVVGMACGTNASQWRHFWGGLYRLRVDGAEIDPEVVRLGREHFGMAGPDSDWLRVFEMDGRQMLEALPAGHRYHMLVVDAFTNELYIPFHLGTREFFALCRRRLEPGGILAMNVYAVGENAPNLRALQNTLATVFGRCVRVAQYGGTNFVILARRGEEPPDLARLEPAAVRRRMDSAWLRLPEVDSLLANAHAFLESYAIVTPREGERVLTDDHCPLEWLTDRFLDRLEDRTLEDDDRRRDDLRVLLARQGNLLTLIGLGWVGVVGVGLALLRRLTRA